MSTITWEDHWCQLPISDIDEQLEYWTTISDEEIDLWGIFSIRDRNKLYASLPVD